MKKYSVHEIDDLRQVCEHIYLFGTPSPLQTNGMSRTFYEKDKIVAVEEMCRTYMTAGITANDLYKKYDQT